MILIQICIIFINICIRLNFCIKLEFTFQRVFNLCNNEDNVRKIEHWCPFKIIFDMKLFVELLYHFDIKGDVERNVMPTYN